MKSATHAADFKISLLCIWAAPITITTSQQTPPPPKWIAMYNLSMIMYNLCIISAGSAPESPV